MYCIHCGNKLLESVKFCENCGKSTDNSEITANNLSDTNLSPNYSVATSGQRFLNYIIDHIGFYIFAFIVGIIITAIGLDVITENTNTVFLGFLIIVSYYTLFEYFWQRTPGKFITRTKVVTKNGNKPTFGQVLGRSFARFIPFEVFSFLGTYSSSGWHDQLSKTLVVPNHYTANDVKSIDLENMKKLERKGGSRAALTVLLFLVGIAVIGILSAIVLASLNSARQKGIEAANSSIINE